MRLEAVAESILQRIASGESLLGYNLIGSYAMAKAKLDPSLGVVLPRDYTLVMSRVMLIAKTAKHPNAARLWVDYVLSQRGQTVMATKSTLFSIRNDVTGEFTAAALTKVLGPSLRPIAVGPGLLVYLDQAKRRDFLKRWEAATSLHGDVSSRSGERGVSSGSGVGGEAHDHPQTFPVPRVPKRIAARAPCTRRARWRDPDPTRPPSRSAPR